MAKEQVKSSYIYRDIQLQNFTARNPHDIFVGNLEIRWLHKFILTLSDLQKLEKNLVQLVEGEQRHGIRSQDLAQGIAKNYDAASADRPLSMLEVVAAHWFRFRIISQKLMLCFIVINQLYDYWHWDEANILFVTSNLGTVGFQSIEIGKKVLQTFDNIFHVYLMNGLQKYPKKNFTMAL